jgi:hypothetical protein
MDCFALEYFDTNYGQLYVLAICYMFWYVFSEKIWQPCRRPVLERKILRLNSPSRYLIKDVFFFYWANISLCITLSPPPPILKKCKKNYHIINFKSRVLKINLFQFKCLKLKKKTSSYLFVLAGFDLAVHSSSLFGGRWRQYHYVGRSHRQGIFLETFTYILGVHRASLFRLRLRQIIIWQRFAEVNNMALTLFCRHPNFQPSKCRGIHNQGCQMVYF